MREKDWDEYLKRSRTWSIRMGFDLLHSEAYKQLKYGPAAKVLNWFHEKVRIKVDKKKRGKNRYQIVQGGEISFTYEEAALRGLTSQKFSRALKELHRFGFIDVKKPGSGLKGDFTIFIMSQRWRNLGTSEFRSKEWPKSVYDGDFGYRGYHRRRNLSSEDSPLGNDENSPLEIPFNVKKSLLKRPNPQRFQQ
jgi:hypothetical protein